MKLFGDAWAFDGRPINLTIREADVKDGPGGPSHPTPKAKLIDVTPEERKHYTALCKEYDVKPTEAVLNTLDAFEDDDARRAWLQTIDAQMMGDGMDLEERKKKTRPSAVSASDREAAMLLAKCYGVTPSRSLVESMARMPKASRGQFIRAYANRKRRSLREDVPLNRRAVKALAAQWNQ
jgi:hypothetical protein